MSVPLFAPKANAVTIIYYFGLLTLHKLKQIVGFQDVDFILDCFDHKKTGPIQFWIPSVQLY
jgi:hypothetical protein